MPSCGVRRVLDPRDLTRSTMTTEAHSAPGPLSRFLRAHWRTIAIVTGLCLVLTLALTLLLRPPVHTAEARLAVGSGQMTALNIPGYPTASEAMASNYARWVNHQGVQGQSVPEGTLSLTASPIVESNVLRIEATSHDPDVAVRAAGEAADALREAVNQVADFNDPEALIQEISHNVAPLIVAREAAQRAEQDYNEARDDGMPAAELEEAFQAMVTAQQELIALELEQDGRRDRYRSLTASRSTEADLVEVLPAEEMGNDQMSALQRNGLLAVLLGLLGAGGAAWLMERRRGQAKPDPKPETRVQRTVAPTPRMASNSAQTRRRSRA